MIHMSYRRSISPKDKSKIRYRIATGVKFIGYRNDKGKDVFKVIAYTKRGRVGDVGDSKRDK